MRRSLSWLVAFVGSAALLQAACASLTLDGPGPDTSATPTGSPTNTIPPGSIEVGDGLDGSLTVGFGSVVVNTCQRLTDVAGRVAHATDAAPFALGRRVLLVQVQGFSSMVGSTAQIPDPGTVGRFEVRTVSTPLPGPPNGVGDVTLGSALAFSYTSDALHRAEICTIPQFSDVNVASGGSIGPAAWNGTSGGIVAFYVSGTLTVNGTVGAASSGLRGGVVTTGNCNSVDVTDLDSASDLGGLKGESIDVAGAGKHGRGNHGNGGGGGNACNAGGGGGGNGGIGGYGGYETNSDPMDPLTMGLPGAAVATTAERLLFGGGGGAGHENNGGGSSGGAGGGAVYLSVQALAGVGNIGAPGHGASGSCVADGCGGGGAGGTIVLRVAGGSTFTGTVGVLGGNGSTMGGVVGGEYGPGGGGGGGRIWIDGIGTTGILLKIGGGANGTTPGNDAWGATSGGAGVMVDTL